MTMDQARRWVSQHMQALGVVSILFILYGQSTQQYWRTAIGCGLAALIAWGRLVKYPSPGQSWHRPFLVALMWGGVAVAAGAVAFTLHLDLAAQH